MKKLLLGLAVVAAFTLVGCDKFQEPFRDAPQSGIENDDPADLIRFPDGFSNAATKCDHGNRVYVVYHGDGAYGSIFVVPQDPSCA